MMKRYIKSDDELYYTTTTKELKPEIEFFVSFFMKSKGQEDNYQIRYDTAPASLIVEIYSDLSQSDKEKLLDNLNINLSDIYGNEFFEIDNDCIFAEIPMTALFNLD